ncbi:MAG TPA: hypothetical protein DEP23_10480 [Ruminococcaceae bacterium]|nr:hypothetical protein [Oscillospiraceae bacterium]
MTKTINFESAMEAITKAYKETPHLRYFGIRGDNFVPIVGQELEESYDWDYDSDCQSDEKLSGTCATCISHLWFDGEDEDVEEIKKAFERHVAEYNSVYQYRAIIGGTDLEYGADPNEGIIKNAEVVYVF